ncbi:MAG: YchE family NAAT transporter [Desulfobacteraceae bacterium]|nr:MAG: YchE family NAAT transporter [Desulfobacteraceae bacterium]
MELWQEYVKFFVGLFSIVNAIGTLPVFINLTENFSEAQQLRTARIAAFTCCIVLLLTLVTGELLLKFFGISIGSFRVGGGILLLLMAISMMHARLSNVKQTPEEAIDKANSDSVAVVPLGLPLLAGPGAISAVILYANRYPSVTHYSILGGEIILMSLIIWGIFRASHFLSNLLGRTGINIVTRIMGLIMAAIGIEFIASGIKQLFPVLA